MSDSVVKLRIDSKEYDANIKRAGDALTDYFRKVKEGGGTLMHLDEGVMEAVQAMGEMGTMAKNAKGGLRELTQATTDMTIAYRSLTDEEKKSPLGQAMAQSIQQLTDRAGMMRDAMDDVNLSIKNVASDTATFNQIAGAANVATSGFQVLQGATKALGIEMGDNVEIIAKLQAAMAVTNGLTQIQAALQKESAFMQGVNAAKTAIATAAQQAYAVATGEATAAQVALNAAMAINPYTWVVVAVGAAITEVYLFIEAINKTIDAGEDLGKAITNSMISPLYAYLVACNDVEAKEKRWQDSLSDTKRIVDELAQSFNILRDSMKLSGASDSELYDAEYESLRKKRDELRKQLGNKDLPHDEWQKISDQIKEVNKAMGELNQKRKTYLDMVAKLKDKSYVESLGTEREINAAMGIARSERSQSQTGSENWNYWNELEQNLKKRLPNATTAVTKPTTDGGKGDKGEKELTIQQQIAELEKQAIAATDEERLAIGEKIRSLDEELAKRKQIVEELHKVPAEPEQFPDIPYKEEPKTPYEEMKDSLLTKMGDKGMALDTTTLTNVMQVAIQNGIEGVDADFSEIFENLPNGISDKTWQELANKINEKLSELGIDPIEIDFKTGNVKKQSKEMAKDWNQAASAIQAVGQAMSQIEDPAAKVIGTMAEAIASVALGFSQASVQAASMGPWGWIAWLGAGLAALTTTISTMHSVTGFADGGIVPGNSFSGDNLRISDYGINSGELILNKSQQNNLAAQLTGGVGNINAQPYLDGEKIFLGMQAYTRRSGLGEIVTSER